MSPPRRPSWPGRKWFVLKSQIRLPPQDVSEKRADRVQVQDLTADLPQVALHPVVVVFATPGVEISPEAALVRERRAEDLVR